MSHNPHKPGSEASAVATARGHKPPKDERSGRPSIAESTEPAARTRPRRRSEDGELPAAVLKDIHEKLLALTLDQLRSLVALSRQRSFKKAALAINRDQSSLQAQISKLNETFAILCGEELVERKGRGVNVRFTATGKTISRCAEKMLARLLSSTRARRAKVLSDSLNIGTTTFTLPILGQIWDEMKAELTGLPEPIVRHVRTVDFRRELRNHTVDLILGTLMRPNRRKSGTDLEFAEWKTDRIVLLTNLSQSELPEQRGGIQNLAQTHTILVEVSMVTDYVLPLLTQADSDFAKNHVTSSRDVYYGLALLRSGLVKGCMYVTQSVSEWIVANPRAMPGPSLEIRSLDLDNSFPNNNFRIGLFALRGRRERCGPDHPITRVWNVFSRKSPARTQVSIQL